MKGLQKYVFGIYFAGVYLKKSTVMAFVDYYKIMGISKDTPQDQINAAYKKRVKQFHPDLHPDDPKAKAKFQALNEANEVLSDPQKRAQYDRYGERWKEMEAMKDGGRTGQGASYSRGFNEDMFSGFDGMGGFSSFFNEFFGARAGMGGFSAGRSGHRNGGCHGNCHQGNDTETTACTHVRIDLYAALLGGTFILSTKQGKVKLNLKPCTRPGTKLRLKGKGPADAYGKPTDLIIVIDVDWPEKLTEQQMECVREMKRASGQ